MEEGNRHLLDPDPDKQRYSAMEVQDPESSSGASLVDSDDNHSSMKINKRALVVFFGVTTLAAAVIVVAVVVSLYSGKVVLRYYKYLYNGPLTSLEDYHLGRILQNPVWWAEEDWSILVIRGPGVKPLAVVNLNETIQPNFVT